MITIDDIRAGSLAAYEAEWKRPVLDFDPGQSATPDRITTYACGLEKNGSSYWCDSIGGQYDKEQELQWCGIGLAWVLTHTLGYHIAEGVCVDVRLHPLIAYHLLPGTDRMFARWRWDDQKIPFPEQPEPEDLIPSDIITVGNDEDGSHFAVVLRPPSDGTVCTIEFNGRGLLGNGRYGEGVVKRIPTKARSYRGTVENVAPRKLDEIKQTYRFTANDHFIGAALEV